MALFGRLRGISQPVAAQFRIVACSTNSGSAVYENCAMDGVVSGVGIAPTPVHHTSLLTPTAKWPYPGAVLPVTVDREHPDRLTIDWKAVPRSSDVARQLAADTAAQMTSTPAPAPGSAGAATVGVVGDASRPTPGTRGGGLTPAETARAAAGGGAELGLLPTSATVLAAYGVEVPAGLGAVAPGGVWDLTLDVAATPRYTTVVRISFSTAGRRAEIAAIGRQLPVMADPTSHDRIAIDASRL